MELCFVHTRYAWMPGMWVELHWRRLINETPEACWLLSIEALGCTIMSRLNQVVFSNTREIPGFTATYPILPLSHPLVLFHCFKSWQGIIFLLLLCLPFNFGGIRVTIFGAETVTIERNLWSLPRDSNP